MSSTLILVRHGKSVWNVKNIFTGWIDVDLDDEGKKEAQQSADLLKEAGINPSICFTSYLKRAQNTLDIILKDMNLDNLPVHKSWKLNERHYGALQGLNKDDVKNKYGNDQFLKWRRSYDVPPPSLDKNDKSNPNNDPLYKEEKESLPLTECLKDTYERVIPYWMEVIQPALNDNTIIIAAHGNSLRALCKKLFDLSDENIVQLEIPTGNPLLINLNNSCKITSASYLDPSRSEKLPKIDT
tara:strand:+ start:2234 stop:2956 length:723 start_codon:yes stop_codon:yes gene_type:complete